MVLSFLLAWFIYRRSRANRSEDRCSREEASLLLKQGAGKHRTDLGLAKKNRLLEHSPSVNLLKRVFHLYVTGAAGHAVLSAWAASRWYLQLP